MLETLQIARWIPTSEKIPVKNPKSDAGGAEGFVNANVHICIWVTYEGILTIVEILRSSSVITGALEWCLRIR